MAKLKYIGTSHFRELLAEDLAKVGVEIEGALVFARGEATEVADDIAEGIHKLLGDEFQKVRKDTKEAVRDLTVDEPAPPQVQDVPPATDWVSRVQQPVDADTANQPEATI
jgi:hypothetical protein